MAVTLKPKVSNLEGTDDNTRQVTVADANTIERTKERELVESQTVKEVKQAEERKQLAIKNLTKAPKLSEALADGAGTYQERLQQERTIHLKMTLDKRPEVVFVGFWDGRLIQSAMNAIARQYRQRRIVASKM